jgi:phosphoglucosamine mutase
LFGTDGVRGVANDELDSTLAYNLGRAGSYVLAQTERRQPRLLIGRDTRISGNMLSSALIAGICSVGAHATDAGVITTPGVAYLTRTLNMDAGVMISASHNPVQDNGIKFFSRDGYKLSDALEERIESILLDNAETMPKPTGVSIGDVTLDHEARGLYIDHCASLFSGDAAGMRIVLDCANGAASNSAPEIFGRLRCDALATHARPNGGNNNDKCGSTHPESLQRMVLERGAAGGFAFDGDADRLIVVDEKGRLIDGDQIMAIIAIDMMQHDALPNNTIVATVMSNMGLDIALAKYGIHVERAAVGDRYVLERMLEGGYAFGGEQSGHFINLSEGTTGDGIVSAIRVLSIMLHTGKTLSELASIVEKLPQVLLNVPVPAEQKNHLLEDLRISAHIAEIQRALGGEGRVLVRPSGTEPKVRIMVEGPDAAVIEEYAHSLAALIEKRT